MYHGLQPSANPLQQTYDQLQNRAIQELNGEIQRLKEIIDDKDKEIKELKEITDEGKLQKKLANLLQENNNLKLQIKSNDNLQQQCTELKAALTAKDDEIYRLQEKMSLLTEEYQEAQQKHSQLNQAFLEQSNLVQTYKGKDNEITDLKKQIAELDKLVTDLRSATKIDDLENELNAKLNSALHQKQILDEENKRLSLRYDELKAKYSKLLQDFDKTVQDHQLKTSKQINSLTATVNDLKQNLNAELRKNEKLKLQIKELQQSFDKMEQLNMKLIKGYNLEDAINDLQSEQNEKLNLQKQLKQITKVLSKKEKTNLVLLKKNKLLTQTLSLTKSNTHIRYGDEDYDVENEEESMYFDHMEEITALKQEIKGLHQQIDQLQSEKYKLLTQIHEEAMGETHKDQVIISGLTNQQQSKIKKYVQRIRKKSLMPFNVETDADDDDEDDDDDISNGTTRHIQLEMHNLKQENTKLKEWKETMMTKLLQSHEITGQGHREQRHETQEDEDRTRHHEDRDDDDDDDGDDNVIFNVVSKQTLLNVLGLSRDEIQNAQLSRSQLQHLLDEHTKYVDVIWSAVELNHDHLARHQDIYIIHDNHVSSQLALKKENEALSQELEQLKGFKTRHAKIEAILNEKEESELIKKVDSVTKENMILIVNEQKLRKKYIDLKQQQTYLFAQYTQLLKYLMDVENYLFNKLSSVQNRNQNLSTLVVSLLHTISSKMVPLNEYKNLEIEYQSLYQTKSHLLTLLDQFQSFSVEYFKCKRDKIALQHQLMEKEHADSQQQSDHDEYSSNHRDKAAEIVYNAEIETSIKTTEKQYEITLQKYQAAVTEMNEMEKHSQMLHSQINELRSICMDQTSTISKLEKKITENNDYDVQKFTDLQTKLEALTIEYNAKLAEIEQYKQKTEFAVSSLQALQTKVLQTLDIDDGNDEHAEEKMAKIANILHKAQNAENSVHADQETVKALNDRIRSLEVEILKNEENFNRLQSNYFNLERTKRVLEANYHCIYSKTLHKMSSKYLSEIDNLRTVNEDLHDYLNEEQLKTKQIFRDMMHNKTIIESLNVKIDDLNDLLAQYQDSESLNQYLKNWQTKCTNLEISKIKLSNENESLKNEVAFLRNENAKYLSNIGSLQKQLTICNQDLQDTKQEIIQKNELAQLQHTEIENKSVQTEQSMPCQPAPTPISPNALDENEKLKAQINDLQAAIAKLKNESLQTEEKVNSATNGLQIMLKTAKDTIFNLQTLLAEKNNSIEEYKQMIDKLLNKLKTQQAKYMQHINELKSKFNENQEQHDKLIISEIDNTANRLNAPKSDQQWMQISEMNTNLQEKENLIRKLKQSNTDLSQSEKQQRAKVNILNTRIDEYHGTIQQLNEKIQGLSQSLSSLKTKLNAKSNENSNLQKAFKALKTKMEQRDSSENRNNDQQHTHQDDEDEAKMKKFESEYKMLRSSLQTEIDDKKEKLNESQLFSKQLVAKNSDLNNQVSKLKDDLLEKTNLIHKLQVQISKIQKDKITMQEKHSLSLKMNKKRLNGLEKTVEKLKKYEAEHHALQQQLQSVKTQLMKTKETTSKLQTENRRLRHCQQQQQEQQQQREQQSMAMREKAERKQEDEAKEQDKEETWRQKCSELQMEVMELKKVIEIKQIKEIKKLKVENSSLRRKYDFLKEDNNDNKQLSKLLDEIEAKDGKIIDLESKITELQFERESADIKYQKLLQQHQQQNGGVVDASKLVISSRNDPQLQNLLDSMRFIINKLKKENSKLRENKHGKAGEHKPSSVQDSKSVRITNLLKENRSLKTQLNELKQLTEKGIEDNGKDLEIERITNLNRKLNRDNLHLQELNGKHKKRESFKEEEINHLRQQMETERAASKQQLNEMEMIWKRKLALINDDLLRFKKLKKELEQEVAHKNGLNEKMSTEIKALIELVDHSKQKIECQQEIDAEKIKKLQSLERENEELKSELSAFDVNFFNEIEDLKYRESEAQQTIIQLQNQLSLYQGQNEQQMPQQHGHAGI